MAQNNVSKHSASKAKRAGGKASADVESVDAFVQSLGEPLSQAVEAMRQVILGAHKSIEEGIKWNAVSFRTTEWFATLNQRGKPGDDRPRLVLHTGAKAKPNVKDQLSAADPDGLLKWLGPDRAMVTLADAADVRRHKAYLQHLVAEWIRHI